MGREEARGPAASAAAEGGDRAQHHVPDFGEPKAWPAGRAPAGAQKEMFVKDQEMLLPHGGEHVGGGADAGAHVKLCT